MEVSQASTEKIRILVRIRPLNENEIRKGHQNVIEPNIVKNSLTIWDPLRFDAHKKSGLNSMDTNCWARHFSYDHCLWSNAESSLCDAQEKVYHTIGSSIVEWAVDGYNTCVLAYGQTGAGKSYTMLGAAEDNPSEFGLIPRICFNLFEYFDAAKERSVKCSLEFSFLQIYNENLKDCLAPHSSAVLKVREHPNEGSYVANLTTVQVQKFEDVLSLITIGNKSRAVASTRANVFSSRSHGIIILTVRQRFRDDDAMESSVRQKISRLHLVDLAGSERSSSSGAVGVRLKEANNINKSLSVLGDVIKCLGDSSKKSCHRKSGHIPYRNSALTMVLRHSLGGNSHTTMVAAVSPSSADYDETISTLKYVDNVKKVRNRVAVNISCNTLASEGAIQLVPVLQAEVLKLQRMLQSQQAERPISSNLNVRGEEALEIMEEMHARMSDLERQLKDRETLIKSLEMSVGESNSSLPFSALTASMTSGDRSIDSTIRSQPFIVLADDAIDTTLPRVINLNQDPLFSECLVYYIPDGIAIAGGDEMEVDILLSGPDILPKHCLLHNDHDRVWIEPACIKSKVYVNGMLLTPTSSAGNRAYLSHFDRISIGRYHLFRFEAKGKSRAMSPLKKSKSGNMFLTFNAEAPGWDFAHDELMLNKDSIYDRYSPKPEVAAARNHKMSLLNAVALNATSGPEESWDEDDIVGLWDHVNAIVDSPVDGESSIDMRERVKKIVEIAEDKMKKSNVQNLRILSDICRAEHLNNKINSDEVRKLEAFGKENCLSVEQSPTQVSSVKLGVDVAQEMFNNPSKNSSCAVVVEVGCGKSSDAAPTMRDAVVQNELSRNYALDLSERKSGNEEFGSAFEDEATLLQRDMKQMQDKLAQRIKRYTSNV